LNIDGVGVAVARRQLLRAAQIAERLAPGTERVAEPLYHLARLERAAGDANRARTLFARALDALESQRSVLGGSDESHAHFSERYARYYLDYIELLIEHGKLEEAFSASERYRARALLEAFVSRHDIAVAGLPRALADEQERAAFRYEEALERVRRYGEPQSRATTFQQEVRALEMARIERNAIEDRVRALTAQRPVATLAQPWSARQVSSRLKRDAALLSYLQTSDAMHLFVIDGAAARDTAVVLSFRIGDVTRLQEEIEAVHVLMRTHVNTPESQGALFKRLAGLHAKLIAPAAAVLRGKQQLIIVPDGALHRVPWLALAADVGVAPESSPRFLIADHAVLVAPSATFHVKARLGEPTQAGRKRPIIAFAGGAQADASSDPNPSETAARTAAGGAASVVLPFAVKETAAIKRAFGSSAIIFSGAQATESRAKQVAASAGMLHFATHAVAMESSPLDS
jgi:CHAT domain-containing protein